MQRKKKFKFPRYLNSFRVGVLDMSDSMRNDKLDFRLIQRSRQGQMEICSSPRRQNVNWMKIKASLMTETSQRNGGLNDSLKWAATPCAMHELN